MKKRLKIPKNVLLLGLISLFTDLSSQMVFPLLPLFLTTILHTGATAVGIIEGAAETTASLLKVISGYWSDKIKKRKPFVLAGYGLSTITKPLFAIAKTWPFVLFARIIERTGKGMRTAPRDAIVAESTPKQIRGKSYGIQRAFDGLGSVLGALGAIILLPLLGYRKLFLFAFIPGIIAVLLIPLIKEAKVKKKAKEKISIKKLPNNLKFFITVSTIFTIGQFGYAFLLLKAKKTGLTDVSSIILYLIFFIVFTIASTPAGIISDKIGRKNTITMGYIIFAITSIMLIYTKNTTMLVLSFILYGIFYAFVDGTQRAMVTDLAPKHLKATSLGAYHTMIGIAALPAGIILGTIWDKTNPETMFVYALTISIISIALLQMIKTKAKNIKTSKTY